MKLKKLILPVLVVLWLGFFLYHTIPLMINEHNKNKILHEISEVERNIELNKQQRLNCSTNMELWNNDNEKNREIVKELQEQYNSMVGFTQAWQPELSWKNELR